MPYFDKMRGHTQSPPRVAATEIIWSGIGSLIGMSAVSLLHFQLVDALGHMLLIGSFGASAVLIYGAVRSPLAQPRNVLGGHLISAFVGVTAFQVLGGVPWLAAAVAVSLSVMLMHWTRTLHPPGAATALIAVIGGESVHRLGYLYVVLPTGLGAVVMLLVALVVNNIPQNRRYPEFW
jgi:CBS-domain-containing membrane protein